MRPDPVPIMMSLQTSSHKPASRILAEVFLWSWRPRNFAVGAVDTDLSMKSYHQNFHPGVKQKYSYVIHSHSVVVKDYPMILSRSKINKIFSTRTGIMSNKKFYGFCPVPVSKPRDHSLTRRLIIIDFCLLDLDSCKTLYLKDISRCLPTAHSSP